MPAPPRSPKSSVGTQAAARWKLVRDIILFFVGLGGVVHEALTKFDRPSLLMVFAAMMGLPAFLRKDEGRKQDSANGEQR